MITITVDNSYSKIEGLSPSQEKELGKLLSYTVGGQSAYFGRGYVRKKSLFSKKCEFPTGLTGRVAEFLTETPKIIDKRYTPPAKATLCESTGYPWQIEALRAAIWNIRGIISAPTGTGKSRVISLIGQSLNHKTLVVVPSLEIKKQLGEALEALQNVVVENIDNPNLADMTDFDVLIIDEAHHVAAKTYQKLNKTAWNKIYYRYFLTATPFRNDTEEQLLFESIAGDVIYELTFKEAVKEGYIAPIEAYYIEIPKQKTDAYTYREVYNELVINHETRNKDIASILMRLQDGLASTLCLVKEVQHGRILSDLTGIPFACGEDEFSRQYIHQFKAGKIPVLIGTTGILGEGIDTKPCEYVIIAGLGKAKSHFMQQVGRAVRKYPGKDSAKVILIKDRSHRFLVRHFNEQKKILLEEYGVIPVKLDI